MRRPSLLARTVIVIVAAPGRLLAYGLSNEMARRGSMEGCR